MKHSTIIITLVLACGLFTPAPHTLVAQQVQRTEGNAPIMRSWVSQQGTTIKARMTGYNNGVITLSTEDGRMLQVDPSQLSKVDQDYIAAFLETLRAGSSGGNSEAETRPAAPTPPPPWLSPMNKVLSGNQPLHWPSAPVTHTENFPPVKRLDESSKDGPGDGIMYAAEPFLVITEVELPDTGMAEALEDSFLVYKLFQTLPWDWQPRPSLHQETPYFMYHWHETDRSPLSTDSFKDEKLTRSVSSANLAKTNFLFAGFGKDKNSGAYVYEDRSRGSGSLVQSAVRFMLAEKREILMPWVNDGLQHFLKHCAYTRSSFNFNQAYVESELKHFLSKVGPHNNGISKYEAASMLETLHLKPTERRDNRIKIGSNIEGVLLFYYFGFLDGDRQGTRFHEYMRAVASERRKLPNDGYDFKEKEFPFPDKVSDDISAKLLQILIAGRTDKVLATDIRAKYKAIGINIE